MENNENFKLIYSPRTQYSLNIEEDEKIYNELKLNFDPITIKIIKKHFKERLGSLEKEEMVAILKNHLLSFIPNHPQREKIMIRLLSRLFSDIDLNDNGTLEWNEFTNYILNISANNNKNDNNNNKNDNNNSNNNQEYRLKFYTKSKENINYYNFSEKISYAFFIEKFNVIGIVQEGKSNIMFFDAKKYKKLKCYIDIKEVQNYINLIEFSDLNEKALKKLEKEEIERKEKRDLYNIENGIYNNNNNKNKLSNENDNNNSNNDDNNNSNNDDNKNSNNNDDNNSIEHSKPKLKKKLNNNNTQNYLNIFLNDIAPKISISKKLSILCTTFIPEFDLILISGTNNTITAWNYINNAEIKNVNVLKDFRLFKDELRIAFLIAKNPQYTMVWDSHLKFLYTGQKDGKIIKWDLIKQEPILEDSLDIKIIKENLFIKNQEQIINNNNNNNFFNISSNNNNLNETQKLKDQLNQTKTKTKTIFIQNNLNNSQNTEKNLTVSCLLLLNKLQLLAASYYNGMIILWDTLLKDYRKCYNDQSTGIYDMCYDSIRNLLFTCGFSHDIFVYDPYIDGSCVYILKSHSYSINSISCNEKESELISVDIYGNIKIWDTNLLINFQTIKINEEGNNNDNINNNNNNSKNKMKNKKLTSNIYMLYIQKMKKIFIYGNKLMFFETDRSNNPDLADDQIILSCYYDRTYKRVLSFCLNKIKIWNILTGKVKNIFDDIMNSEITAVAVDRHVKRGFIGDNTGKIKNINLKNGLLIKDLTSHNNEINFIVHSMILNIVVSCSIDNVIKIHDDKELLETEVIKEIFINQFQVKGICIVERFKRLAIGLNNGIVKFYDIEHFHFDSDLTENNNLNEEVSFLLYIDETEFVLVCFANGICKFIVAPPSTYKFNTIYEFNNNSNNNNSIAITFIEFDKIQHRIFIGDLLGNVKCYSIENIYEIVEQIKTNESRNFDNETIITKENHVLFDNLNIPFLWETEAHKMCIKHIHYVDIDPQIIITTSNDLRIKIFNANSGEFLDEFKQISTKQKPIPISIKYYLFDPFVEDDKNNNKEPLYFTRKDIEKFIPIKSENNNNNNINNNNNQLLSDYSKKIMEYNAKEKLYYSTRNSTLPYNMSNNWKLNINISSIIKREEEEYEEIFKKVKEIEKITNATEIILQEKSIYSENYKPKYIEEMSDMDQIREFSKVIAERLRNVKLAVSKANLNRKKMIDITNKNNIEKNYENKKKHLIKNKSSVDIIKSENIYNNNKRKSFIKSKSNIDILNLKINLLNKVSKNKNKIFSEKIILPEIKSKYSYNQRKLNTPAQIFNNLEKEFKSGINQIFNPFHVLLKKSKKKLLKHSQSQENINDYDYGIKNFSIYETKNFLNNIEGQLNIIEQDNNNFNNNNNI